MMTQYFEPRSHNMYIQSGLDVVKKIESNKTDGDDGPIAKVVIAKSGQL